MKEKILEIINHYGVNHQQRKFQEEVFELQEAIIRYDEEEYKYIDKVEKCHKDNITQEIADCYVLLEQFRLYYDIPAEQIKEQMQFKINRQLDRIEKEVL